ncbi:MAG TPA: tRNA uridine-5-carboxymethylaminomethyl(34) synthesis enzyme MnmG [candidate division Zixibacteria bacterium]|nr:tRNA uridine-5-carboxymethylaminomethyl(34) synthesis enzyme MnmG [candidate division Zixibacteria bacterium]MDD4917300.1 tRNA uridine-5-carboxymethylaminomethyl(34) synthesis enzyme MnmG [candidate division Zixibacteria bacterium]MDM7971552.1 tRNA uridine-5-carboxymethylaminomethyl(34) synthesis enzyme MnmG [candidate division Zixibacteria bacterium]HOD65454.1 tRNA uridine-5-carboxymethylaminomethyl(34) synthesis enzyme MnmG [candidate division Zixibacteria bacterium]HPM36770.1 tRNA uridine
MMVNRDFDIVVVGGGHAGVEAALAAARMGKSAAFVTMDPHRLALMSCNPAIGGIGKSHIVKEVDALGGVMGIAIDATGIQFRRLNLSRGPAVWSTRAQADRIGYNRFIVELVRNCPKVSVIPGLAGEILTERETVVGIRLESGDEISCRAAVIATGTFLGGLIHIGRKQIPSGRIGEPAAYRLSESFRSLGFEIGRMKTGTPPRLDGDTIDWGACQVQPGDEPVPFFSPRSPRRVFQQVCCHLTYTTSATKAIIGENFHLSPMFSGQIKSRGPRYCPSIEDKFFRFADKERHQLFLEPEGNGTNEVYPNGFSTALPEEVQVKAIRTVAGLENVRVTRPGYAVEYDYCPAHQIKPSLETRRINGLFLAGQINGTSGYEEAAGQGIMAGINAVLRIEQEAPFVLDRSEAYIGVMIDDLTTRSTTEPYRMFTSRAEYRLTLREDNARDRLQSYARRFGLIPETVLAGFDDLQRRTDAVVAMIPKIRVRVDELGEAGARFTRVETISLDNLLRQPTLSINEAVAWLRKFPGRFPDDQEALERAAIVVRYSGYVDKQQREIDKFRRMERETIPDDFDFAGVSGLKKEAGEKLARFRPTSLGQAGRIEGITPGDVAVLSVYLQRHKALSA